MAAKSGKDPAAAGGKGLFSTACFLTDVPIPSAVSSPSQSPVRDRDASGGAGAVQVDGRTSGKWAAGCGGGPGAASVWVDGEIAEAEHILARDADIAPLQLGLGGGVSEAEEQGSDVLLCQADLRDEAGLGGGLGGSGRIGDGRRDVAGAWQHVAGQLLDAMYSLVEAARRSLSLSLSLSHSFAHPPTHTHTHLKGQKTSVASVSREPKAKSRA